MVHLTRIYTRTGDAGTTGLGDMSRPEDRPAPRGVRRRRRDELRDRGRARDSELPDASRAAAAIQNDLFDVGADLCTPVAEKPEIPPLRVTEAYVERA